MKTKRKLIFIGPLLLGQVPIGGDVSKNRLFVSRFSEIFDKVYAFDTIECRRNLFALLKMILSLIFIRNAKVVVSCEISAAKVIDFLYYFRVQKEVFYWVVGSGFVYRIEDGTVSPKHYHFLKAILVQSPKMVEPLKEKGLKNGIYIPNSKPIYDIPIKRHDEEQTKFVFLSRILPEKGTEYILDCIERLSAEGYSKKVSMAFYGVIMNGYSNLQERINQYTNVEYKGKLNLTSEKGYEELASYDAMLFPTYYEGEGFPGVFIDAFIAGLPVITTDWHFNTEVITDKKTGYIIPPKDKDALYKKMKEVVDNKELIVKMRHACKEEAKKFDRNVVLSLKNLREIGLID